MAASPEWKIYSSDGEYMAATKYAEDAAVLVGAMGEGATVRCSHSKKHIVWTEGNETISASESFDECAEICRDRRDRIDREFLMLRQATKGGA